MKPTNGKRAPVLKDRPPLVDFKFQPGTHDLFGLDDQGDLWVYVPKKERNGVIVRYSSWRKLTRRALDATRPGKRQPHQT